MRESSACFKNGFRNVAVIRNCPKEARNANGLVALTEDEFLKLMRFLRQNETKLASISISVCFFS